MGNLKLSKTAIRELTRLYRGVLVAAIIATAVASTGAKAVDYYSVTEGGTPGTIGDLGNKLGSAAFKATTDFDAAGAAADVQTAVTSGTITAAKATADGDGNTISTTYAKTADLGTMASKDAGDYYTKTAADAAFDAAGAATAVQTAVTSGTITAAKATADGDGNTISTTYAKTADLGTMASKDAADYYTKTAADAAFVKADLSNLTPAQQGAINSGVTAADVAQIAANKTDIGTLNTAVTAVNSSITSINTQLTGMYTKTEVDTYLNGKADKSTTYTKTEVDTALNAKVDSADLDNKSLNIDAASLAVNGAAVLTAGSTIDVANIDVTSYDTSDLKTEVGNQITTAISGKANVADITVESAEVTATNHLTAGTDLAGNVVAVANALATAEGNITDLQTATTFTANGNYYTTTNTVAEAVANVDGQVKTNADNIGDLQTATTFTTNGNYYTTADTVAVAVGKVDAQVKTNADEIAKRTVSVTSGVATITDGTNTADVYTTAKSDALYAKLDANNTFSKNNTFSGDVTVNGKTTLDDVTAADITADSLVAANGIQAGASNAFTVDSSGAITNVLGITSQGAITTTGSYGITAGGDITTSSGTVSGKTLTATTSLKLAGTEVTSINTAAVTSGTGSTGALATTSSVVGTITAQAQGATFTPTTSSGISATTIGAAINEVAADYQAADTAITNGTTNFTGFKLGGTTVDAIASNAITSSTASTTTLATTDAVYDTVIAQAENGTYSGGRITGATGTVTLGGAVAETVGQVNKNTATIGAGTIAAGTAGTLTASTIGDGTGSTITVTKALETLNATNVSQNTTLNALAGLVDGGSVDAATGARTAGTAIAATKATGSGTAGNLVEAVNAASTINQAQNTALGVLNADGTYKATGLTHNAFKSTSGAAGTTLAGSLDNLATRVATATGTTYKADGTFTNAYGSTNNIATTDNLSVAIGKLDAVVGDVAFTGTNATGSTDLTKAVNALDNAIGNRASLGSANSTINSGTATSVAAGLKAAGDVIGDQNYSSTKYVSAGDNLTTAIGKLDQNIEKVENKVDAVTSRVDKVEHKMKSGFASLAAMSGLVPNARGAGDTQIAMGAGYYRGTTGFALGAFHHINDNMLLNVGASYAGNGSAAFKGGVTFGF